MSEMRALLVETATRAMAEVGETFSDAAWRALADAGLPAASIAEEKGGAGADLGDAMAILRVAGKCALAAPLAETMLASWLLSESGLPVPSGPLTVAPVDRGPLPKLTRTSDGWRLGGAAWRVPWARRCEAIAVLAESDRGLCVARVPLRDATLQDGANIADEPRDDVTFTEVRLAADTVAPAGNGLDRDALWRRGALARTVMMAGALEAALEITVRYAGERSQFGRPIGKFQAIQQQVAELAAASCAASVASDAAVAASERGPATFEIAAAKARVGEAAGKGAAIAHQVHGAIGFTREYRLNLATRRLWSWREEFGDEAYWWAWLGRTVAPAGGAGLWPLLTSAEKPGGVPL